MTQQLPAVSKSQPSSGARTARRPTPPEALVEVALIDGRSIAAAGCMGLTQWHELVRSGKAPQPVIKQPRFTRWRVADIRAWLEQRSVVGNLEGSAK
jgi:predicted DNA-binding transcriptional regulator AlpA